MAFTLNDFSTQVASGLTLQALNSTGVAAAYHKPGYEITLADGRKFKYCLFDSSGVAAVAGAPVHWQQTTTPYVVTADLSDSPTGFAGVATAIYTDGYYVWVQTGGRVYDAAVSTNVAAGNALYGVNDGQFDVATDGTNQYVAVALETDTAGLADIMIL